MDEAFVDVRGCDYSGQDLSTKVFSGVLMRGANFANCKFTGVEFARVDAKGADLSNADFTDANGYSSIFDGANLENAQFENAILTGAQALLLDKQCTLPIARPGCTCDVRYHVCLLAASRCAWLAA